MLGPTYIVNNAAVFLDFLAGYAQQYELSIWGYCLMSNHFHLVAVPAHEEAAAKMLGRLESDDAPSSTCAAGLPVIFGRRVTIPSPRNRPTAGEPWPTSNAIRHARE
jgi:hypothetical protein